MNQVGDFKTQLVLCLDSPERGGRTRIKFHACTLPEGGECFWPFSGIPVS